MGIDVHCSAIHVLKGWIDYQFAADGSTIRICAHETIYVPKGCRYLCIYPSEETRVAIFNFDILPGSIRPMPQQAMALSESAEHLFRNFKNHKLSFFYKLFRRRFGISPGRI